VNLTNFTLVEPTGQPNAPGEGHLHYYLDAVVPTNASAPAIPETGGYVISTNTSYTWENVTAGAHNFSVQVVNNDHTPIIPLVFDTVNVTVIGGNATVVNLTAENIAFDTDTITVPAGANVTVNFNNKDSGIPHNFAVYDSSSGLSGSLWVRSSPARRQSTTPSRHHPNPGHTTSSATSTPP
jgi:plastocyanin